MNKSFYLEKQLENILNLYKNSNNKEFELRLGSFHKNKFISKIDLEYFNFLQTIHILNPESTTNEYTINKIYNQSNNFNKKTSIREIYYLSPNKNPEKEIKKNIRNFDIYDYNIRLSLSSEEKIKFEKDTLCDLYREKKRKSILTKDNKFKFDFTIVRTVKCDNKNVFNPKILEKLPDVFYEVEIEYIDIDSKTPVFDIKNILYHLNVFNYHFNFKRKINKPINFTKLDIKKVKENYSITEKADGTHFIIAIFFNNFYYFDQNDIYHININDTKLDLMMIETEYLEKLDTFFGFDTFYFKGKNIMKNNLQERYKKLLDIIQNINIDKKITNKKLYFYNKDFGPELEVKDIFQMGKKIYESKFDYHIDGLIFTPMNVPYFDFKHKIYKWKPKEEMTIDFFVKVKDNDVQLFCQNDIKIIKNLNSNTKNTFKNILFTKNTVPSLFVSIPKEQFKNEELEKMDGKVIEMSYIDGIWKFYRIREDKTKEYEKGIKTGEFKGPNFCRISKITRNDITNALNIQNFNKIGEKEETAYYKNVQNSKSTNMRKLHNQIKNNLIQKYLIKNGNAFDIGGGRGGDLLKFKNNNAKFVLLMDPDEIGLSEAKKRYEEMQLKNKNIFNLELLVGDATKNMTKEILEKIGDKKFDLVSAQFCLHYFLKNKTSFNNFFKNINIYLNKGGYFIATFLDGITLFDKLKEENEIDFKGNNKIKSIFKIEKKYKEKELKEYGQKILVTGETFGEQEEYLVNMDFIDNFFKENGYEKIESDLFENMEIFKEFKLTQGEKGYSGINRYIVFKKL
jgi:mRNA (guanine-N7-)-methyltransferase